MSSNETRPFRNTSFKAYQQQKPPVSEDTLKSNSVEIERKTFVFTLRENLRGRFLRVTEEAGGRHATIIIPAPGLEAFKKIVDEMARMAAELPPHNPPDE